MTPNVGAAFYGLFIIFALIPYIGITGLGIYCLVLFIKLARRGIKALDIYINKNQQNL